MQRVSLEDKRECLQQALLRVIARDGIEQASVRNIASEANINPAAVSYAFSGKEELMMSLHHALQAEVNRLITQAVEGCTSIEEGLSRMATAYFDYTVSDPSSQRAHLELTFYALARSDSKEVAKMQYEGYVNQLVGVLSKLEKSLLSKADITSIARLALAMMDGVIIQYLSTHNLAACKKTISLAMDLLLHHCTQLKGK